MLHNEYLYADEPKLDADNRFVLAWAHSADTPANNRTMHWDIASVGEYFSIRAVIHNEYAYASESKLSAGRRYLLAKRCGADALARDRKVLWDTVFGPLNDFFSSWWFYKCVDVLCLKLFG